MPHIELRGAQIWYEDTGGDGETILFGHGLLLSGLMYEPQVAHFRDRYRCITFDFRGQGRSEVTEDGYDMDSLALDALALIEKLGCGPVHYVGLSMGGFVGLRLAIGHRDCLRSLTLIDTSADPEPKKALKGHKRLAFVLRWFGARFVVNKVLPIMFGKTFLTDPSRSEEVGLWRQRLIALDRKGTAWAAYGVLLRNGVYDRIGGIDTPTLIIVGEEDTATVPSRSERMHEAIDGSKLVYIENAGHLSSVEKPSEVNAAIERFLEGLG